MFYPVESLRRGGRFYLCWVADSWPLRFATITHRQLWSQDIRQICDDLLDVYTRESGYASARFSLRLSSQLMRGLVRLYQKKVAVFLSDLCMINATTIKHTNHRPVHHGAPARKREAVPRLEPAVVEEIPGNEDKLEERMQASGNVVANIEEITLKELAIPEIQIPADGFGEENQEQALQDLLANRTVEEMLGHTAASAQLSDLLALDTTDKSIQDKSRLAPNEPLMMERISEHDMTLFRKSTAANDLIPMEDVEKEILQIPDIPDIPLPELPVPQPEKEKSPVAEEQAEAPATSKEKEMMDIELELEELEEIERQPKRKRARRLVVDKRTKISGLVLRHRLEHVNLELRCEDSSEDIIDPLFLPAEVYLQRPACVGWRPRGHVSCRLLRLFKQNLGYVERAEHNLDMEQMLAEGVRRHKARMPLTKIVEEAAEDTPRVVVQPPAPDATLPEEFLAQNITEGRPSIAVEPIDIMDLPTQVLLTESQEARKRTAEIEDLHSSGAKKLCQRSGTMSFRQSQLEIEEAALVEVEAQKRSGEKEKHFTSMKSPQAPRKSARRSRASNQSDKSVEKLLDLPAPPTYHEQAMIDPEVMQKSPEQEKEMHVSQMLEEVGLADARNLMAAEARQSQHKAQSGEESSETQLGSLDRTKVDFGDSDKTTDTQRFLRKEWGTQGTMLKVVRMLRQRTAPLSVRALVGRGPAPRGLERVVAARCFTALLKLKQHAFVVLTKDPTSLEITDISCGAKLGLP